MKVVFSIILSVSLIFQTFNLQNDNLGDMGELLEHYQYHSLEYEDSLADFLVKHYGSKKAEHSNEHSGHDELPFNHNSSTTSTVAFVVDFQNSPAIKPFLINLQPEEFFYSSFYTSLSLGKIFQPPRAA